jgi:hypothetical protein
MIRIRTCLLAVMSMGFVAACALGGSPGGPQYPLTSSPRTPAAEGNINVDSGPNGNTKLSIKVRHLAPPSSVTSTATTYVAWIVPRAASAAASDQTNQETARANEQQPINVGAIMVDDDLKGTLETITPFRQFDLMITPEPSPVAMRPSNKPVLTARVQNI